MHQLNIIFVIYLKSNISVKPSIHIGTLKHFSKDCQLLLMVNILMLFQGCYTNIIG